MRCSERYRGVCRVPVASRRHLTSTRKRPEPSRLTSGGSPLNVPGEMLTPPRSATAFFMEWIRASFAAPFGKAGPGVSG